MKKVLLTVFAAAMSCAVFSQAPTVKLSEGTIISIELKESLSSKTSHVGDVIEFETAEPVIIGDRVILNKGLKVYGSVTQDEPAQTRGKGGILEFNINYLTLADGRIVKLTSLQRTKGKKVTFGYYFVKSKESVFEKGQAFKAFVSKDYDL